MNLNIFIIPRTIEIGNRKKNKLYVTHPCSIKLLYSNKYIPIKYKYIIPQTINNKSITLKSFFNKKIVIKVIKKGIKSV